VLRDFMSYSHRKRMKVRELLKGNAIHGRYLPNINDTEIRHLRKKSRIVKSLIPGCAALMDV